MKQSYTAGEYIIDFANLYQITLVEGGASEGQEDLIIHYKPVSGTDKVFTASIPERNLKKSGLRRVLTKTEIEQLMDELSEPLKEGYNFNAQLAKEDIYLNVPGHIVSPLKYLWNNSVSLPKAVLDLKEEMLNHLCFEISFVTKKPAETVRESIEKKLEK